MRITITVCRQHIGRMIRRHWITQGQLSSKDTGIEEILAKRGVPVCDINSILTENRPLQNRVEVVGMRPPVIKKAEHHKEVCHFYRTHNVLLEGLEQAKVVTKTVEIQDGLPDSLEQLFGAKMLPNQDELVRRCIFTSHLFNAVQEKLPHLHDPLRPAFVFPRLLGLTEAHCSYFMSTKILHLCSALFPKDRKISTVSDSVIVVPVRKDGDLIQFDITANFLLTSSHPLPAIADAEAVEQARNVPLPDLTPVKHTITLEKENVYHVRDEFPLVAGSCSPNVHTAFIHYNKTEVKNMYETPVTENQVLGRSLMFAFAIAAAQAKQKYGATVQDLPAPITIQCIQTDGRLFHFTVFQLNTLNLDGVEGTKNIFWMLPRLPLFDSCKYEDGRPILEGYNGKVFDKLLAFCTNK